MKPNGSAKLATLTIAVGLGSFGALSAMDSEQVFGPNDVRFSNALENKQYDRGVIRVDDVVDHAAFSARYYGLGVKLDGWMALGQDTSATDTISPGEITQFKARADYLLQIDYQKGMPLAQILPHFEVVTYPDQSTSLVKNHQRWIGADGWINPPFVGFQGIWFGGNLEWNASDQWLAFTGSFGARELIQYAPYDFQLFQLINFGNAAYNRQFGGLDDSAASTIEIGGKVTYPLIAQEWWSFVKVYGYYWLDSRQRDLNKKSGVDSGGIVMSVGVEWVIDKKRLR